MHSLSPGLSSIFINDTVNQQIQTAEDMNANQVTRVLMIYTGGTIGMKNTPTHGYTPVPGFFSKVLARMTRFNDPSGTAFTDSDYEVPVPGVVVNPVYLPYYLNNGQDMNPLASDALLAEHSICIINGIKCVKTTRLVIHIPILLTNYFIFLLIHD